MAKTFKIYDEQYELYAQTSEVVSGYGFRNEIVDEPPGGKFVGYVTLEDGSIIQCFKKFNPLPIIIIVILFVAICGAGAYYIFKVQPKDVVVNDNDVKTGTDHDVITYNGFMSLTESAVDIALENGSEQATVTIVGDGVKSDPATVEPHGTLDVLHVTYDTDAAVVNATIKVTTATSTYEQPVTIEIPENDTMYSPDSGLDNYWRGETIYGIDSSGNATTNTFDDVQDTE